MKATSLFCFVPVVSQGQRIQGHKVRLCCLRGPAHEGPETVVGMAGVSEAEVGTGNLGKTRNCA